MIGQSKGQSLLAIYTKNHLLWRMFYLNTSNEISDATDNLLPPVVTSIDVLLYLRRSSMHSCIMFLSGYSVFSGTDGWGVPDMMPSYITLSCAKKACKIHKRKYCKLLHSELKLEKNRKCQEINPLLEFITNSDVQSSTRTFFHTAIVFIDTSNNAYYKASYSLIRTPGTFVYNC